MATPKAHVRSRRDLSTSALLEVELLSMVGADALGAVFGSEWCNYQENGNWGVDRPERQHMHVHVYGRTVGAVAQPYGEALRFPFRAEIPAWRVDAPSGRERDDLWREAAASFERRRRS